MVRDGEECIAEFDETTHLAPHPAELESGDAVMGFDVKHERAKNEAELVRLLAEPHAETIREGIEAYKRDLPKLLADHQEQNVVAYRGSTRLGIAPTRESLVAQLRKQGIREDEGGLYIKKVRDLDDDDEQVHVGCVR
jgi:hypothetical protein